MRVSTRPISPRRFCSVQRRASIRTVRRAIDGPYAGLELGTSRNGEPPSTLVFTARGRTGHYEDGLWVGN